MSEHPIIFSGAMVRAILDGRKTMTRRIVKPQPAGEWAAPGRSSCPYGKPGDTLFVRENGWQLPLRTQKMLREGADTWESYYYYADGLTETDRKEFKEWGFKCRPSIHMPRWASRITLEVTGVRVERIWSISAKDIIAEGAVLRAHDDQFGHNPISAFDEKCYLDLRSLWAAGWNKINAKRAPWASNPWVWVIEFKRV